MRFRPVVSVVSAVALAVVGAPPALASTISLLDDPDSGGTFIDYVAAPGEVNQLFGPGIQSAGRFTVQWNVARESRHF